MELTGYGRSTGFCVDPIEKKPLNHFLPGSSVLSFGTAGCNLACAFCQNHDISKSREVARLSAHAMPETIARAAERLGCASVAYTYNDPVIFMEYALDTADACRARGIKNVAVTAGFICEEPRKRFFAGDGRGQRRSQGLHRALLRKALRRLARSRCSIRSNISSTRRMSGPRSRRCLIPGENDSEEEIEALTRWFARELKADVPLHFTAFHPDYHMLETAPTPLATLQRARAIARQERAQARLCRQCPRSGARRRRSARPAGRAASAATAIRSRPTRSTPPAPARAAERRWRAFSPKSRATGARAGCRSRSSATRREGASRASRQRLQHLIDRRPRGRGRRR